MTAADLDPIDKAILYLLQENARGNTTTAIGEKVGIAGSTAGTRINRMEGSGVIQGYNPIIDYERAGFDHHYVVTGTVPFEDCDRYIEDIVDEVDGVVNVRKFFTANANLSIELVGMNRRSFEQSIHDLKALDVAVERFRVLDREVTKPFSQFGQDAIIDDELDGSG